MKQFFTLVAVFACTAAIAQQAHNVPAEVAAKSLNYTKTSHDAQRLHGITPNSTNRVPLISEDFEALAAPAIPAGWTAATLDLAGYSGFYTGDENDANVGGFWPVPNNGSSQFIMTNDDALGSPDGGDLSDEQLWLPSLDFAATGNTNHGLSFDVYHDMNFGSGNATVSVSIDGGATFTLLTTLTLDNANWQSVVINLAAYDAESDVIISFGWNDGGNGVAAPNWGTGLALDNIVVDALPGYNLTANGLSLIHI